MTMNVVCKCSLAGAHTGYLLLLMVDNPIYTLVGLFRDKINDDNDRCVHVQSCGSSHGLPALPDGRQSDLHAGGSVP